MAPLTISLSGPLAKCLLPAPTTLCSTVNLEVLILEGRMLPSVIPLNWKLRLPPTHFGFLMPLNEQRRELPWADVTDPFPRENWTVTPQWNKEEYVWNIGDPLGCFLV